MNSYRFIDDQKANHTPAQLCRALEIPDSSYSDWHRTGRECHARRDADREKLVGQIAAAHDASNGTYGSPRVHAALHDQGVKVSLRRVSETMSDAGIVGLSGREHTTTTTRRDRLAAPIPDLVKRGFLPDRPNHVWYGDITYVWIRDKFWYLATVIDAATKELVGYSFRDYIDTRLISEALNMAVRRRGGITPNIFHSDRGCQYTSHDYGQLCKSFGIKRSMGRRGVCYDNAGAESFFATIKRELIDRYYWDSAEHLATHLFNWVETWYNRQRLHTSIGMKSPRQKYVELTRLQAA